MRLLRTGAGHHRQLRSAAPSFVSFIADDSNKQSEQSLTLRSRTNNSVNNRLTITTLAVLLTFIGSLIGCADADDSAAFYLNKFRTTTMANPPRAWLTPSDEPSNAARPVMCSIRDSYTTKCDLNLGPDDCHTTNWTSAVTFTAIGSEVIGTFVDLPDRPISSTTNSDAAAHIAYKMPASRITGGISVAVVRISASCCVRRLTVVGYTSAGSADHCNLNLCEHSSETCLNGGLCTSSPGKCACKSQWTGPTCAQSSPVSNMYWPSDDSSSRSQTGQYNNNNPFDFNNNRYSQYLSPSLVANDNMDMSFNPQKQQQQQQQFVDQAANSFGQMTLAPPTVIAVAAQSSASSNQRWCPDKFLCCDHGLAYYDPDHRMMCCNNRAVPIARFSKACPELGGQLRGSLLVRPSAETTMVADDAILEDDGSESLPVSWNLEGGQATPERSHSVPPGVVLVAKAGTIPSATSNNNNSTASTLALLQRLALVMQSSSSGIDSSSSTSNTFPTDMSDLATLMAGQNDMIEMICNGITHWVPRNNRARYGCCGGKIFDIVWDSCAVTSTGLGVIKRPSGESSSMSSSQSINSNNQNGGSSAVRHYATMSPPPMPMGMMLKTESEARNRPNSNIFKNKQLAPSVGPSVQRRRRLISLSGDNNNNFYYRG